MNSGFVQNRYFENFKSMALFPLSFLFLAVIFEYSGFDLWWVSLFFDYNRGVFPYHSNWFLSTVIHTGGQWFDKLILLVWIISFIFVNIYKNHRKHRKILLYFLIASAVGPLIIGILKSLTHIQTPSHINFFNGIYPYVKIFDHVPEKVPVGHAFPAGHASGGYGLLCLYFVLFHFRSARRFYGLVPGVLTGLLFGISQQIRGAHFPSHDLVTITICWYSAFFIYLMFYPYEFRIFTNSSEKNVPENH